MTTSDTPQRTAETKTRTAARPVCSQQWSDPAEGDRGDRTGRWRSSPKRSTRASTSSPRRRSCPPALGWSRGPPESVTDDSLPSEEVELIRRRSRSRPARRRRLPRAPHPEGRRPVATSTVHGQFRLRNLARGMPTGPPMNSRTRSPTHLRGADGRSRRRPRTGPAGEVPRSGAGAAEYSRVPRGGPGRVRSG